MSKNPSFIKLLRNSASIIPLAVVLLASTFSAGNAHAGVFSLFKTAESKTSSESTQTIARMKILEVVFSPTLNGQGGLEAITDESALVANDNPLFDDSASPALDVAIEHVGDDSIKTYKVKSGDSLSVIADKFGVSTNTIVWANNLDRKASLKIGETLTILPVSGIQYTVKKGDTMGAIAIKYGAEISDIRDYNDKTDSTLVIGEKIVIPGAELVPISSVKKVATSSAGKTVAKTETSPAPVKAKTVVLENKPTVATLSGETINNDTQASVVVGDVVALPIPAPVFGELIRPKTNSGDSSNFIRPIEIGIGRLSQGTHDKWAVDIAAPIGTSIMAASAGTVILVKPSGYNGGYGKYVAIEHAGGVQTLYAHMTTTKVNVGDVVAQGQVIGLVGSTGRSTGPHVHYEVRGALNNCLKGCE